MVLHLCEHSPAEGHLVCFQVLGTMCKTSMNISVQVLCERKFSFLRDKCPRVQLLCCPENCLFTFLRKCQTVSQRGCTVYSWVCQVLCIPAAFRVITGFHFSYSDGCGDIVVFICISLLAHNAEHLFMCFFAICYPLQRNICIFWLFSNFFFFFFLLLGSESPLCALDARPLLDIWFASNIFSHSVAYVFTL